MDWRTSGRTALALAAGLVIGQFLGPAVAWAADRLEVNWPSVFRIEAGRTLPMEIEKPVEVKVDRYNLPTVKVEVEKLPPVEVKGQRATVTFSPLHSDARTTTFIASQPDGSHEILRLDRSSGAVSRVGDLEL
ncbi:MAG: hypothetical protein IT204_07990 [Fimbriimonadaceae bacterium]|nr:hypothetical protein [Fimbriimonadaceae bacterium]